jgi:hypothetical protein
MRIATIPDSTPITTNQRPSGQKGPALTLPKVAALQKRSDQKGITQLVEAVRKAGLSARKSTRLVTEIISQMSASLIRGEDVEVPGGKIVVSTVKGETRKTHFLHTNPDKTQEERIHRYPGRRSVIKFRPGAMIDDHWPAETQTQQPPTRVDLKSQALVQEIKIRLSAILGVAPTHELLSTLRKMFRNDSRPLQSIRDSLLFIQQTGLSYDADTLPGAIRMVEEIEIWGGPLSAFDETLRRSLGDVLKDKPDPLGLLRDDLRFLNQLGVVYKLATLPQVTGCFEDFRCSLAEVLNDGPPDLKFIRKVLNRFRAEQIPHGSLYRRMQFLQPLGSIHSQSAFLEALTRIEAIEDHLSHLLDGPPALDFMSSAVKIVLRRMIGSQSAVSALRDCLFVIRSRGHVYHPQVLLQQIANFDYACLPGVEKSRKDKEFWRTLMPKLISSI